MPTLLNETRPTARKEHTCWACGTTIKTGETYRNSRMVYDDRAYTIKCCLPCDELLPVVYDWAYRPDEGVVGDHYAEWASDHGDDPRASAFLDRLRGADTDPAQEDA